MGTPFGRLIWGLLFAPCAFGSTGGLNGRGEVIVYVDATAAGANNGSSWVNAYTNLQPALLNSLVGDEIRVSVGVYRADQGSGDRTASFQLRNGITLKGGFAGLSNPNHDLWDPNVFITTLTGDIGLTGQLSDNTSHVVEALNVDASAVLDGFTITAGSADGLFPYDRGAGLYVSTASPTILNTTISQNWSSSSGAGADVSSSSSPLFSQCAFISNSCTGNGGGVYSSGGTPTFTNCTFSNNSAGVNGGGLAAFSAPAILDNCVFTSNFAEISGGAIYNQSAGSQITNCDFQSNIVVNGSGTLFDGGGAILNKNSASVFKSCKFYNNTSSDDGGAVVNVNGSPVFQDCKFGGNLASNNGGAIFSSGGMMSLACCVIIGNRSMDNGGGVFTSGTGLTVGNCTFMLNHAGIVGGGLNVGANSVLVANSIVWANDDMNGWMESSQFSLFSAVLTIRFTCMQGWSGVFGGVSNFGAAPMLVDPDGWDNVAGTPDDDVHLLPQSPCTHAGDPALMPAPNDTDIDGQPRIMGCRVDIGADEYLTGLPHSGDVNGDGQVNGRDIQPVVQAILGTASPTVFCVADLNSDLLVDQVDLALFIGILLGP